MAGATSKPPPPSDHSSRQPPQASSSSQSSSSAGYYGPSLGPSAAGASGVSASSSATTRLREETEREGRHAEQKYEQKKFRLLLLIYMCEYICLTFMYCVYILTLGSTLVWCWRIWRPRRPADSRCRLEYTAYLYLILNM